MQTFFKPKTKSFKKTFCVFIEKPLSEIENIPLAYHSPSGSKYYYTSNGMYRLSNHWGKLANSKWRLETTINVKNESKFKLGYADFSSFLIDNDTEKLYYLEYKPTEKTINYQHKSSPNPDQKAVLRNTAETRKRIKQARNILNLTNWSNHFHFDDLDILRSKIIHQLIYTEKTLEEIKSELHYQSQLQTQP
jgi:hypothetical protein